MRTIAAILVLAALGVVSPAAQQREGIKVHGDWVIEVRNADGTLAQRHEFKNALVANEGDRALAWILSRGYSTGRWDIVLRPDQTQSGICQAGTVPASCTVTEFFPGAVTTQAVIFYNLQVLNPLVNPNPTIELTGSVTASRGGNISAVETFNRACLGVTAPADCRNTDGDLLFRLTRRVLPTAISIAAGQIVQVKVVLSFS